MSTQTKPTDLTGQDAAKLLSENPMTVVNSVMGYVRDASLARYKATLAVWTFVVCVQALMGLAALTLLVASFLSPNVPLAQVDAIARGAMGFLVLASMWVAGRSAPSIPNGGG